MYAQGDLGESLYVVMGTSHFNESVDGKTVGRNIASPSCFGERALLMDDPMRPSTVRAITDEVGIGSGEGILLQLHHSNFVHMLELSEDFAAAMAERRKAYALVQKVPSLQQVGLSMWDILDAMEEQQRFGVGHTVFKQGEIGDCMYFISKGTLDVCVDGMGKVAEMGPGDYFGEVAILSSDSRRTATVRTTGATHLIKLSKTVFERILAQHEDFAAFVQEHMAKLKGTHHDPPLAPLNDIDS